MTNFSLMVSVAEPSRYEVPVAGGMRLTLTPGAYPVPSPMHALYYRTQRG